jgi:tetratricopeptide (TPR) repeat protein
MDNSKDYLYIDSSKDSQQTKFKVSKTSKIEHLINEKKYLKALELIDKNLEKDSDEYYYFKAIVFERQEEYEKSVNFFNKIRNQSCEIKFLKSNALYKWAKITYFPALEYEKALELIDEVLNTIPENQDPSEYYFLKGEILEALKDLVEAKKSYLIAYKEFEKLKEFEKQVEYLENTDDTLINISGGYYYNFTPTNGMIVKLVKEPENEHDSDAIAVYLDKEKIGYVANSEYTLMDKVKSASKIKNQISENASAEILFVYLDEYTIARIIF